MEYKQEIENTVNKYYEVFKSIIDSIMKSQLLLDEDMEIINYYWREYTIKTNYKQLYALSTFSLINLCCTIFKKYTYSVCALTLTPPFVYLFLKMRDFQINKNMSDNVNQVLLTVKLQRKLNSSVFQHFQKRISTLLSIGMESQQLTVLTSERSKEFIFNYEKILIDLIGKIKLSIRNIHQCSKVKEIDYYVNSSNFNLQVNIPDEISNFTSILDEIEKLNQVYLLITSSLLSCISLSVCFDLWKGKKRDVNTILCKILPDLNYTMKTAHRDLCNSFDNVRFTLQNAPKRQKTLPIMHVEQPLLDFLNQIQITFELGKTFEEKLRKEQFKHIDNLIECLETICAQYLKSNTILTSMQKTLIKQKNKNLNEPLNCDNSINHSQNKKESNEIVIRYDDIIEPLQDEEYSLSIHGSDEEPDELLVNDQYENLLEQIATQKLLMQELNNKLIIVRKKKGIDLDPKYPKKHSVAETANIPVASSDFKEPIIPPAITESLPPPPPPPLPTAKLNPKLTLELQGNNSEISDKTYISTAVKNCAKQLNRPEEIFSLNGSDTEESDV